MPYKIKISFCHTNPIVGDIQGNLALILKQAQKAHDEDAQLAIFGEQVIGGYAAEGFLQWPSFIEAQVTSLVEFARQTKELTPFFIVGVCLEDKQKIYNCAALIGQGKIWGICPKQTLAEGGIFYENRYFTKGKPYECGEVELLNYGVVPFGDLLFQTNKLRFALQVCEDLWAADGPLHHHCQAGAQLIINLSASPYRRGIYQKRKQLLCQRTLKEDCTIIYNNLVGGNDNLIFDGGGFIATAGDIVFESSRFIATTTSTNVFIKENNKIIKQEALKTIDLPSIAGVIEPLPTQVLISSKPTSSNVEPEELEELLDALTLGLGDYFEKSRAFERFGLALSGGRDSLLCLLLVRRYLKKRYAELEESHLQEQIKKTIEVFYFPTEYSTSHSQKAAQLAADEIGIPLNIYPIQQEFLAERETIKHLLGKNHSLLPITEQNIQSRIRAQHMWNWANSAKALILQTGNMSEKAVGYCTIAGDLTGGLAPLGNLEKTLINKLLDYLARTTNSAAIHATLQIPPSAELAPNQQDERDLMPYVVLDECLRLYVGHKYSQTQLIESLQQQFVEYNPTQLEQWILQFLRLFHQSIYKWVQGPISLHIQDLDLDRERALQLPAIHRRWE